MQLLTLACIGLSVAMSFALVDIIATQTIMLSFVPSFMVGALDARMLVLASMEGCALCLCLRRLLLLRPFGARATVGLVQLCVGVHADSDSA